jgi:hypothetical protein
MGACRAHVPIDGKHACAWICRYRRERISQTILESLSLPIILSRSCSLGLEMPGGRSCRCSHCSTFCPICGKEIVAVGQERPVSALQWKTCRPEEGGGGRRGGLAQSESDFAEESLNANMRSESVSCAKLLTASAMPAISLFVLVFLSLSPSVMAGDLTSNRTDAVMVTVAVGTTERSFWWLSLVWFGLVPWGRGKKEEEGLYLYKLRLIHKHVAKDIRVCVNLLVCETCPRREGAQHRRLPVVTPVPVFMPFDHFSFTAL